MHATRHVRGDGYTRRRYITCLSRPPRTAGRPRRERGAGTDVARSREGSKDRLRRRRRSTVVPVPVPRALSADILLPPPPRRLPLSYSLLSLASLRRPHVLRVLPDPPPPPLFSQGSRLISERIADHTRQKPTIEDVKNVVAVPFQRVRVFVYTTTHVDETFSRVNQILHEARAVETNNRVTIRNAVTGARQDFSISPSRTPRKRARGLAPGRDDRSE